MYLGRITIIEMLLVATAGCAAIVVPIAVELDPALAVHRVYDVAFLPIMAKAVEGMKGYSIVLVAIVGLVAGGVFRSPAWLLGFSTMAVFPVWSLIDVLMGASHNLLPVEWAIYFGISLFGVLGAVLGRYIQKRIRAHSAN